MCGLASCKKSEDKKKHQDADKPKVAFQQGEFPQGDNIQDADGNTYKTLKIDGKTWMAENLRTRKYANGDPILNITEDKKWSSSSIGAYCTYNNATLDINYGYLYNWYAATDARNICPKGWHLPSKTEWETLIMFLGGETEAGGKLKTKGYDFWDEHPNTVASNSSGMSVTGSGFRHPDGYFNSAKHSALFWTNTPMFNFSAYNIGLLYYNSSAKSSHYLNTQGLCIRCIED